MCCPPTTRSFSIRKSRYSRKRAVLSAVEHTSLSVSSLTHLVQQLWYVYVSPRSAVQNPYVAQMEHLAPVRPVGATYILSTCRIDRVFGAVRRALTAIGGLELRFGPLAPEVMRVVSSTSEFRLRRRLAVRIQPVQGENEQFVERILIELSQVWNSAHSCAAMKCFDFRVLPTGTAVRVGLRELLPQRRRGFLQVLQARLGADACAQPRVARSGVVFISLHEYSQMLRVDLELLFRLLSCGLAGDQAPADGVMQILKPFREFLVIRLPRHPLIKLPGAAALT